MPNEQFFDVAVVGAGPAGIAAAVRAAAAGARVAVIDESPRAGGQIWRHRAGGKIPAAARRWLDRFSAAGVTVHAGTTVLDVVREDDGRFALGIEHAGAGSVIFAGAVVLATGARERFVPFPGWTLPGVYGVGGVQALLKCGTDFTGKRVVLSGSGPLLLPVAAALRSAGARVALVAEQAPFARVAAFGMGLWRKPAAIVEAVRYRAGFLTTPYRMGTWISEARGKESVREVVVTNGRSSRTIPCDVVGTGFGLVPSTELARLLGCAMRGDVVAVDQGQQTSVPKVFCAGEPTGVGGVDLALVEGELAGAHAGALASGREEHADLSALRDERTRLRRLADAMNDAFALRVELRSLAQPSTIVCRCEDVPLSAIDPTWTPRQAKLYTRTGMGPCQGRICGGALEVIHGWPADSVRLPTAPVLLGTLASPADAGSRSQA